MTFRSWWAPYLSTRSRWWPRLSGSAWFVTAWLWCSSCTELHSCRSLPNIYIFILLPATLVIISDNILTTVGRAKKTKKFATMKRMVSASDPRLKDKDRAFPKKGKKEVCQHMGLFLLNF